MKKNEWRSFSLDFVADSSDTLIQILGSWVASDVWYIGLDNVSVEESTVVPEPSTMYLLGTGLAGLAGLRARRKEKAERPAYIV